MARCFNIPDPTVTITPTKAGEATVEFGGRRMAATFDKARRGWVVDGQFSPSAKLHSIGRLFGIRRAVVAGHETPEPVQAPIVTADDPLVRRQLRRILASMNEFGFDAGGLWRTGDLQTGEIIEGWSPRVGGDPIFHTIGQVSGVFMNREHAIEALAAVLEGRRANLPPRMQTVPAACKRIAEALAYNLGGVTLECGLVEPIQGPMLPDDWTWDEPTEALETEVAS